MFRAHKNSDNFAIFTDLPDEAPVLRAIHGFILSCFRPPGEAFANLNSKVLTLTYPGTYRLIKELNKTVFHLLRLTYYTLSWNAEISVTRKGKSGICVILGENILTDTAANNATSLTH